MFMELVSGTDFNLYESSREYTIFKSAFNTAFPKIISEIFYYLKIRKNKTSELLIEKFNSNFTYLNFVEYASKYIENDLEYKEAISDLLIFESIDIVEKVQIYNLRMLTERNPIVKKYELSPYRIRQYSKIPSHHKKYWENQNRFYKELFNIIGENQGIDSKSINNGFNKFWKNYCPDFTEELIIQLSDLGLNILNDFELRRYIKEVNNSLHSIRQLKLIELEKNYLYQQLQNFKIELEKNKR